MGLSSINEPVVYNSHVLENVTGVVLAGGKSRRMGRDKRFIEYGGKRLIDISLKRLQSIVNEVVIVTAQPEDLDVDNVEIISDLSYGQGPLMGIYTGLVKTNNQYVVVNPVDTPNVQEEFLEYMITMSSDFDVIMPKWDNKFEPLIAVYSRNVIPVIEHIITDGLKPAPHLLASAEYGLNIKIIGESELKDFGNPEVLFANINFPKDLPIIES